MNKFYRLLSVVTLALSVALWSCKGDQGPQGPAGPQGAQGPQGAAGPQGPAGATGATGAVGSTGATGTNGTNGKDGNANVKNAEVTVKVADWKTVDAAGIGTGNTGQTGAFEVMDANVSAGSIVVAYVKVGAQWLALPRVIIKETDGSTEQVNFAFQTGKVTFFYSSQTAAIGGVKSYKPQTDLTFSYVTIEKTLRLSMEASGVNLRSRESVNSYLQSHR